MDPHPHSTAGIGGASGNWTNEKHLHFLSVMEATFVRNMLSIGSGGNRSAGGGRILRLDRYVPDISESTRDLKGRSSSDLTAIGRSKTRRRRREALHGLSNKSWDRDQVIPRIQVIEGDEKESLRSDGSSF
ncbi:hypothetical protein Dimus_028263 [Dionaea muscipula]